MANTIVFDTELLGGRFLFKGRVLENRNLVTIWGHKPDALVKLREVLSSGCLFVSFNGIKFDLPVTAAVLAGLPYEKVKRIANAVVQDQVQPWQISKMYGLPELKIDHIDLIEVAPSFVGLKAYGSRMHMRWLKDLPFPHDVESLTEEEFQQVDTYCENDLDTTEELYRRLRPQIDLRIQMSEEYGVDLRSKSDTQMAETAFIQRLGLKHTTTKVPYSIRYVMPSFITFESTELQALAERIQDHEYLMNQTTGHVILPDFLKEVVKFNKGSYQLGVGGIHSTHDRKVCHVATEDYIITDIDAASYYPSIIINCNLIPKNTGERFLEEYRTFYDRRIAAKKAGDKKIAEGLKVPLNGTFGKTASRWSPLYSPDLALAITLTGQLTLLGLIERLEAVGATCLSANTDGICIGCPAETYPRVQDGVKQFEELTKFEFEYTPYRVLAMKDVNNYFAVKTDRSVKTKGIYAAQTLSKNPNAQVCSTAVANWLAHGVPFEETIYASGIEGFLSARSVTGGGVQGGEYLGKVVRWYNSTDKTLPPLTYKSNGNKVPKTDGARACMLLPDAIPEDLDYEWYIKEAIKIAINVGAKEYLSEAQIQSVTPPPKVKKSRKTK